MNLQSLVSGVLDFRVLLLHCFKLLFSFPQPVRVSNYSLDVLEALYPSLMTFERVAPLKNELLVLFFNRVGNEN